MIGSVTAALSAGRLLCGVGALTIGVLLVSSILLPSTATFGRAQASPCVGTLAGDCVLALDNPVLAVLSPDGGHYWLLAVPELGNLHMTLGELGADYRIYLYGPDSTLVGLSDNPGDSAESIEIPGAGPGLYVVIVDSPRSEFSDRPYYLAASLVLVSPPSAERDETALTTPPVPPPVSISAPVAPLLPSDLPLPLVEPTREGGPTRTSVVPATLVPPTRTPTRPCPRDRC